MVQICATRFKIHNEGKKKEINGDKNSFALFKITTKPKVMVFDDESIAFQF